MRSPPRLLIVDDEPMNRDIFETRLATQGYEILTAADGEEALNTAKSAEPDLILLDVNMPKIDGFEVCHRLKSDDSFPFTPIIMVTALADTENVVEGLSCGADEYLTKPVDQGALVARVKSMLRIKELHDTIQAQNNKLEAQSAQLEEWNEKLEQRVQKQIMELERMGRLKRFFSPQIVERLITSGDESFLQSHRRDITVVFCDLRGFTAFTESATPEAVMDILREYHADLGAIIFQFDGTLEHFDGDGMMVFFNDPETMEGHEERAVRMAIAMRDRMHGLTASWEKRGYRLGFGIGIAQGEATLGMIGFEGRNDYAAVGLVVNLASRLCDEAKAGQILISPQVMSRVGRIVSSESVGELNLKGLSVPVPAANVIEMSSD